MSSNLMFGIAVLVSLVLYQIAARQVRLLRLKRAWTRGHEALKATQLEVAEQEFRRCVRLMPMWKAGRSLLGVVLAQLNRLDEAEEEFKMVASLEPRQPDGHLALAYFYATHRPERAEEAVLSLREAVQCDPALLSRLRNDPRLGSLRNQPAFQHLLDS